MSKLATAFKLIWYCNIVFKPLRAGTYSYILNGNKINEEIQKNNGRSLGQKTHIKTNLIDLEVNRTLKK